MSVAWKIRRLSAMGLPEIGYRLRKAARTRLESVGLDMNRPPEPGIAAGSGRAWLTPLPTAVDAVPYRTAADRILDGTFDLLAGHTLPLGFPPPWNRDPKTGTQAPLTFGKLLDYRQESLVGDIKYLWEPNRHLELVTLAQASHLTGEQRYREGCRVLLDSWFEQCPYPRGPNWTSSLEHAIRLVNWAFAWHLLGGEGSPLFADAAGHAFRRRWLASVFRHCHFIHGYLSRYSSGNNHLLGELTGLYVGSTTWPLWKQSAHWQASSARELEREALRQNYQDGVNREQATWYHHAVADMMLIAGLFARGNGCDFGPAWWQRLESMLSFIAGIMDVAGNVPRIGDSDDGVIVRLAPARGFDVFRSLLASGAVLFGRPDFKARSGGFDDKSLWLLGEAGAARFRGLPEIPAGEPARRAFPDGGYHVLGDALGTEREVRLVADTGPLGYLAIAAHGHADALAFTLSVGGREFLVDAGTYAYHTQPQWRAYFRGTAAHNTLQVDGLDQSVIAGNFMWSRHAHAGCESWESDSDRDRLIGWHDGYERLDDPVRHTREILFDKQARLICVTDALRCSGRHQVRLHWHCHEAVEVGLDGPVARLRRAGTELTLSMSDGLLSPRVAFGEEQPPLGWISRRFDARLATHTIVWSGYITGATVLRTRIALHG